MGHLPGSVNIGLEGRFAETAGMVIRHGDPIVVIASGGRGSEAAMRLARIGFDTVVGALDVTDGFPEELRDLTQTSERLEVDALEQRRDSVIVLDVRNPGEVAAGSIAGSIHIPLAELAGRHAEVPSEGVVVVYCAGGWRSSVAASLLRARGHRAVTDLRGGYGAWSDLTAATR